MGAESNAVGENLLTGPGGTIPLTISLTSPVPRALRNLPLAAPAELMTGDVGIGGGWTRTTLWGVLPAGSNLAPGNYTGRVNFMLYAQDRNAPASYTPSASRTVTLSVNVLAYVYAQLEIDGVASDFGVPRTLDLGELVAGAKRSFKIRISSNTRYKLSALSSNNGNLLGRANNGLIPYTLRPFGLEDFANGRSVSFNIEIGKLNNAPPGIYTDEVQLTVTAL